MASITPYFVYRDGAAALDFLERAFGFERLQAYDGPDGDVVHAEMRAGDAAIMFGTATGDALDLDGYEWSFGTYGPGAG